MLVAAMAHTSPCQRGPTDFSEKPASSLERLTQFAFLPKRESGMYRRKFVGAASLAGLTAWLARPVSALAPLSRNGLGLQLWTVRNQLETDAQKTLEAIRAAGYEQIELMNVVDSRQLVQTAQELGLKVRSAFFNWETVAVPGSKNAPQLDTVIEVAHEIGLEYLVFGYIGKQARDTADKMKTIADNANEAAEKIADAGMKMSYHNHSFEFEQLDGGQAGFEILMDRFDPKLINFELDVFWAAIGGWDPLATLKRLGQRVGQIHLKDLKSGVGTIYDEGQVPKDAFQEVGDGIIDMTEVMKIADANGVTQFHVEQDQSPDPIASIGQSAKFVRGIW